MARANIVNLCSGRILDFEVINNSNSNSIDFVDFVKRELKRSNIA
jgi:hypothetical protein